MLSHKLLHPLKFNAHGARTFLRERGRLAIALGVCTNRIPVSKIAGKRALLYIYTLNSIPRHFSFINRPFVIVLSFLSVTLLGSVTNVGSFSSFFFFSILFDQIDGVKWAVYLCL